MNTFKKKVNLLFNSTGHVCVQIVLTSSCFSTWWGMRPRNVYQWVASFLNTLQRHVFTDIWQIFFFSLHSNMNTIALFVTPQMMLLSHNNLITHICCPAVGWEEKTLVSTTTLNNYQSLR